MSFAVKTVVINSPVLSPAGTLSVAYPTGTVQADFTGVNASGLSTLIINDNDEFTEAADDLDVSYGVSTITVTNKTDRIWISGDELLFQFDVADDVDLTNPSSFGAIPILATGTSAARSSADRFSRIFSPLDFGANCKGNLSSASSANDDTQAFLDCIDAAANFASTNGAVKVRLERGTTNVMQIEEMPEFPIGVVIEGNGVAIGATSALDGSPVLKFTDVAAANSVQADMRELWIERIGGPSDWSHGPADACVQVEDIQSCTVHVKRLRGKTTGIYLPRGSQYVTVDVNKIIDCKYGIYGTSTAGGGVSNNQNYVSAGSFRVNSNVNLSEDVFAWFMTFSGAGYQFPNNWRWKGTSVEFNRTGSGRGSIANFEAGLNNLAEGLRHESNDGPVAIFSGPARRNVFEVGYAEQDDSTMYLEDTSTSGENFLESRTQMRALAPHSVVIDKIQDKLYSYDASNVCFGPGKLLIRHSGDDAQTLRKFTANANLVPHRGFLKILNSTIGVGFKIDTRILKSFYIVTSCMTGFGGRRKLVVVTENGEVHYDVTMSLSGIQSPGLTTPNVSFGGGYGTGSDSLSSRFFRVSDGVIGAGPAIHEAYFFVTGGSASCHLKSIKILSADGHVAGVLDVSGDPAWGDGRGGKLAAAEGDFGLYTRGELIGNVAATSVATSGLLACTLSGRKAPAHLGDGLTHAQYGYYTNSGNVYWALVGGAAGTATKPTGTDPTAEYVDGEITWKYERPLATLAA